MLQFPRKLKTFYIQLLYKARYFVNNIMCNWNLFLVFLTNGSFSKMVQIGPN